MADSTTSVATAEVLAVDTSIALQTGATAFGITPSGFNPKAFARLLAEKLALARSLMGEDLDLSSGSAIRKILEVSALEDARTWAALNTMYDNGFIATATGEALSRLGEEQGLPRPFLQAAGRVKLKLVPPLPASVADLRLPRGSRLLSVGGHHAFIDESVVLSAMAPEREVAAIAVYPGASHNLDPGVPSQKLSKLNRLDPKLEPVVKAEQLAGKELVRVEHITPFAGGELQWPDDRYRDLLLAAPRSLWTVDAIRIAASLVPGVRQVQVRDAWGGLDIRQSIFGNFNFIERLFAEERDLATPYYFTVLVAPTIDAIWEGPDGLQRSVESAIEDLRPIGIFPQVQKADIIGIGVKADLLVRGIPMATGKKDAVNASAAAVKLKERLMQRVRGYVDNLDFGDAVRSAEVTRTLMNEPGIADVQDLALLRFPAHWESIDMTANNVPIAPQPFLCGVNVQLQGNQIAVFVDDPSRLMIV